MILQTCVVFARVAALLTCKGLFSSVFELALLEILKLIAGKLNWSHLKGFSPECMYMCVLSLLASVHEYSHCVQTKGFFFGMNKHMYLGAISCYTGVFTLSATERILS